MNVYSYFSFLYTNSLWYYSFSVSFIHNMIFVYSSFSSRTPPVRWNVRLNCWLIFLLVLEAAVDPNVCERSISWDRLALNTKQIWLRFDFNMCRNGRYLDSAKRLVTTAIIKSVNPSYKSYNAMMVKFMEAFTVLVGGLWDHTSYIEANQLLSFLP